MKPFIGIFDGKIKNGKVLLPDMPDKLVGILFHLVAVGAVGYTYLKILPDNKSSIKTIKREIENHEMQITYAGTVRSGKDGSLFIPNKARILSGLN